MRCKPDERALWLCYRVLPAQHRHPPLEFSREFWSSHVMAFLLHNTQLWDMRTSCGMPLASCFWSSTIGELDCLAALTGWFKRGE